MHVSRPAITRLLVANRGEIARRVFRTAREMGIATVAVFTEADRHAPFVAEADEALALDHLVAPPWRLSGPTPSPTGALGPPGTGAAAYLNASALVEAALRAGADAVHPGYGLLADNAAFAWRCAEAGLIFVGPAPEAIATMASKLEAKAVAAGAGVPVLEAEEVDGYPPGKLEAAAEMLGWPVMVKASAGGGGRGLRVVREGEDLVGAVEAVRREAVSAFGDGAVFLEPWLESARHIEVQVFGDSTGRVVHLFERECSVQRRYQKVIAEAPAPKLPQPMRERLHTAAVAVAEAIGFVGAGTVEFLLDGDRFWFLEMDTSLAAEHPATEAVLGLDLVRMQLAVAEGRAVPVEARHCSPSAHAVGARLYAEDPAAAYRPQAGVLRRFEFDGDPGLRVESGVTGGAEVGHHDGGPLATVMAHAVTRGEATRRLAAALAGMRIHGLRTNRDQLVAALHHPEFQAGPIDIGFLDRHHAGLSAHRGGAEAVRLHAAAAAFTGGADPLRRPPAGPGRAGTVRLSPADSGGVVDVSYRTDPAGTVVEATVAGEELVGLRATVSPDGSAVDLEVDGRRRRVRVSWAPGGVVDVDSGLGHTEFVALGHPEGYEA